MTRFFIISFFCFASQFSFAQSNAIKSIKILNLADSDLDDRYDITEKTGQQFTLQVNLKPGDKILNEEGTIKTADGATEYKAENIEFALGSDSLVLIVEREIVNGDIKTIKRSKIVVKAEAQTQQEVFNTELKKAVELIAQQSTTYKKGSIRLKGNSVYIIPYLEKGKKLDEIKEERKKKVQIIGVDINIHDGVIDRIKVTTEANTLSGKKLRIVFDNWLAPIKIENLNDRIDDALIAKNSFFQNRIGLEPLAKKRLNHYCIVLGDFLEFNTLGAAGEIPYDNPDINLSPTNPTYDFEGTDNVNTLLDINAFTDIGGLANEPNGIIQTEFSSKFFLNTINSANAFWFWLNYIQPSITLSKFDSTFEAVPTETIDDSIFVNRTDVLQRTNARLDLDLNLLRVRLRRLPRVYLHINIGGQLLNTRIFHEERKTNLLSFAYYSKFKIQFLRTKYFGLDLLVNVMRIRMQNNAPRNSAATIDNDNAKGTWFWQPQALLHYHPRKNRQSRLFARFNLFVPTLSGQTSFAQWQFGYALSLDDLINRK